MKLEFLMEAGGAAEIIRGHVDQDRNCSLGKNMIACVFVYDFEAMRVRILNTIIRKEQSKAR